MSKLSEMRESTRSYETAAVCLFTDERCIAHFLGPDQVGLVGNCLNIAQMTCSKYEHPLPGRAERPRTSLG